MSGIIFTKKAREQKRKAKLQKRMERRKLKRVRAAVHMTPTVPST
jgi:hypothetical protein